MEADVELIRGRDILGFDLQPDVEYKVKLYDFKRPDKFSKEQLMTLNFMHETFARLATLSMGAMTQRECSIKVEFEIRDGEPVLVRLPEIDFIDDKEGKPVGIHKQIGRRPIAAFGNSDGDLQMLQWTTAGPGARLGVIVHHTDAEREWAYDRDSHVGRLDKALDLASEAGWTVVDMRRDWKTVHAARSR